MVPGGDTMMSIFMTGLFIVAALAIMLGVLAIIMEYRGEALAILGLVAITYIIGLVSKYFGFVVLL